MKGALLRGLALGIALAMLGGLMALAEPAVDTDDAVEPMVEDIGATLLSEDESDGLLVVEMDEWEALSLEDAPQKTMSDAQTASLSLAAIGGGVVYATVNETVLSSSNGNVPSADVPVDATIHLSFEASDGFYLNSIQVISNDDGEELFLDSDFSFAMPDYSVTVKATFLTSEDPEAGGGTDTPIDGNSYNIYYNGPVNCFDSVFAMDANGIANNAVEGNEVQLFVYDSYGIINPDGFSVSYVDDEDVAHSVTITYQGQNDVYGAPYFTFIMPAHDVTVTVAAFSYYAEAHTVTIGGDKIDGEIQGVGDYYIHDQVTLTAPKISGYSFVGWYYGTDVEPYYYEGLITRARSYSYKFVQGVSYAAVYKKMETVQITLFGGESYTVNGDAKSGSVTGDVFVGTVLTVATDREDFDYWRNSLGMIVSRDKSYTFTATKNETISAEFKTGVEGKATLIFESYFGQIMARNQYAAGDAPSLPALPGRNGYTTLGWDLNGDGKIDDADTMAAAIERGLASPNNPVRIYAVYEPIVKSYTITVKDGIGGGTYNQNELITVQPSAPKDGEKFSHWEDWEDDKETILSYNAAYSFYVERDQTLKAVFVKEDALVDAVGTTAIVRTYRDASAHTLTFVSMSSVPKGCAIQTAGVIATNDATIGASSDGFNSTTAKYVLGNAWGGTEYRFTFNKGNVKEDETWYVRAYLVYTDPAGDVYTVYGDMVCLSLNDPA